VAVCGVGSGVGDVGVVFVCAIMLRVVGVVVDVGVGGFSAGVGVGVVGVGVGGGVVCVGVGVVVVVVGSGGGVYVVGGVGGVDDDGVGVVGVVGRVAVGHCV